MGSICWLLLAALLVTPLSAIAQFSEATDVVVVEVPVQVIGADGKPVRGLTADNFEVYGGAGAIPWSASRRSTWPRGRRPGRRRRRPR